MSAKPKVPKSVWVDLKHWESAPIKFKGYVRYVLPSPASKLARLERKFLESALAHYSYKRTDEVLKIIGAKDSTYPQDYIDAARLELARREARKAKLGRGRQ